MSYFTQPRPKRLFPLFLTFAAGLLLAGLRPSQLRERHGEA